MGYNFPTNDPFDDYRRKLVEKERAQRDDVTASGTQSFQVVKKLKNRVHTAKDLALLLPVTFSKTIFQKDLREYNFASFDSTRTNFADTEYISTSFVFPEGKTKLVLHVKARLYLGLGDKSGFGILNRDDLPNLVTIKINGIDSGFDFPTKTVEDPFAVTFGSKTVTKKLYGKAGDNVTCSILNRSYIIQAANGSLYFRSDVSNATLSYIAQFS